MLQAGRHTSEKLPGPAILEENGDRDGFDQEALGAVTLHLIRLRAQHLAWTWFVLQAHGAQSMSLKNEQ
jgi:hypothetical protein